MKIFYSTNLQGQIIDMINSDDDKIVKKSDKIIKIDDNKEQKLVKIKKNKSIIK